MADGPPPDLTQPFVQGQQGNVQGSDGSVVDQVTGAAAGVIDGVKGAVGDAVGNAVGLGSIMNAIGTVATWVFERISSGLAHFANTVFNNMFYGLLAVFGGVMVVAGFIMLINATPAGDAVRHTAGSALGIATKVLPI